MEFASFILIFAHSFREMTCLDSSPGAELCGDELLGGCHFEKEEEEVDKEERRGTDLSIAVEDEGKNEESRSERTVNSRRVPYIAGAKP